MTTLLQSCVQLVANNLQQFDLEDFPDEFIIKYVIVTMVCPTVCGDNLRAGASALSPRTCGKPWYTYFITPTLVYYSTFRLL